MTYGDVNTTDKFETVALIGRGRGRTLKVQFISSSTAVGAATHEIEKAVGRELDFYINHTSPNNPCEYLVYHCGTTSNLYSDVHWGYKG